MCAKNVSIVVIAHAEIANSFAHCVEHILAKRINNLHILAVKKTETVESILKDASDLITKISYERSVLILVDLFGSTPSNLATKLVVPGKVELITGINLPMLIRAVTYSSSDLNTCVDKVLDGGHSGIIHIQKSTSE